jgi:hypothetical protein
VVELTVLLCWLPFSKIIWLGRSLPRTSDMTTHIHMEPQDVVSELWRKGCTCTISGSLGLDIF